MPAEPLPLDPALADALRSITTATLTTVLLKKGLRNVWMRGAKPLAAGSTRQVGRAFTLRFVPAREDLATPESWASPISTRAAIENMPAGCIAVVDAMRVLMRNGPQGGNIDDTKEMNTVFATVDQVAADAYGATLIGQHRDNLPYLKMGHERGLGTMYWENLKVREV